MDTKVKVLPLIKNSCLLIFIFPLVGISSLNSFFHEFGCFFSFVHVEQIRITKLFYLIKNIFENILPTFVPTYFTGTIKPARTTLGFDPAGLLRSLISPEALNAPRPFTNSEPPIQLSLWSFNAPSFRNTPHIPVNSRSRDFTSGWDNLAHEDRGKA